jgi:delta 1-pyrroline-5-carboxylate dehydrogenase
MPASHKPATASRLPAPCRDEAGVLQALLAGVQPFGGEGLSGTGPKAGGSHYLYRFCAEQTLTINTAAAGGNAALLAGQPAAA